VSAAREHLLAELDRVELLLRRRALALRDGGLVTESEFRGLFVADEHVDRVPLEALGLPEPPAAAALAELAAAARVENAAHAAAAAEEPPLLRLARLSRLGELERDALLLAAGSELDLRWERLLAYVQDDVTRKRPTLQLALDLFCDSPAERLAGRALLADGPLVRDGLVRLADDRADAGGTPLPARALAVEERVLSFLLGEEGADPALAGRIRELDSAPDAPGLDAAAAALADGVPVVLHGRADPGGSAVAAALGARVGRGTIAVDLRGSALDALRLASAVRREARLRDAAVYLAAADELPFELVERIASELADARLPLVLRAREPLADPWPHRRFGLDLPRLDVAARRERWSRAAGAAGMELSPAVLDELASKLALDEEQTAAVLGDASRRSDGRPPAAGEVESAARAAAGVALAGLAGKVEPRYRLDDLVLPERQLAALRGLLARVRGRTLVYGEWGFAPVGASDGVIALFHGASGTGKTMAAEVLAAELGLELYRIDLSGLVSKYIGETEKNLRRVFLAASTLNAILLFDEADALFGRRSEVKDAHDRYANVETAYLLGELESFSGLTVLATNLVTNLDDAFRRRIHVAVEFPMPELAQRERLWRRALAAGAPLADDVDLRLLARRIELSGAVIRNACLDAAFAAAADGGPITLAQLVRSTAAELEKLGRPPTRGEFGDLHELLASRSAAARA
jgi:hypothetical protein